MTLQHKSGVLFEYIRDIKPQFTNEIFVELLNLKTKKHERFTKSTYLNWFKIIKD